MIGSSLDYSWNIVFCDYIFFTLLHLKKKRKTKVNFLCPSKIFFFFKHLGKIRFFLGQKCIKLNSMKRDSYRKKVWSVQFSAHPNLRVQSISKHLLLWRQSQWLWWSYFSKLQLARFSTTYMYVCCFNYNVMTYCGTLYLFNICFIHRS